MFLKQHFYAVLTLLLNCIWSFGVVRSRSWKTWILQIFGRYYDFIEGWVRNKHAFKHNICQLKCVVELSFNDCLDNEQRTCYGIWQNDFCLIYIFLTLRYAWMIATHFQELTHKSKVMTKDNDLVDKSIVKRVNHVPQHDCRIIRIQHYSI